MRNTACLSKTMTKQKELRFEQCLVCESNDLEKIVSFYSRYNPRFFHNIAICRDCGHIQVYPVFSEKEYEKINRNLFGTKYLAGEKQNKTGNTKKLQKMAKRISPYIKDKNNILDVGAGEAWAMDHFRKGGIKYYAIEAVDRLSRSIEKRGGIVIGETIFSEYTKYKASFEIIIFRHILEHMVNPRLALLNLRNLLHPNGFIYLAVPNAACPSIRKGFRTSFIRPAHLSYFCEGNLLRLTNSVGLESMYSESGGEIFCLLKHRDENSKPYKINNNYLAQKEVFLTKSKEALKKDILKAVKDLPLEAMRRIRTRFWQKAPARK